MTSLVLLGALMSKDSEAIRQARVRQLLAQMTSKLGNIAMVLFLVALVVVVIWFMAGQVSDPPEQLPYDTGAKYLDEYVVCAIHW
jgi:hypothetical protein